MNLETKRLVLRPLSLEDAEGNYPNWLNDKEVCRYNTHGDTPYTKAMAQEYITMVNAQSNSYVFAIVDKKSHLHIGNIALQSINQRNNSAELAILIGEKSYWRGGYGYEASKALLHFGFHTLKLHRIYCGTPITNVAMQKLALKLGFSQEGVAKEAFFKNGLYYDTVVFGVIHADV